MSNEAALKYLCGICGSEVICLKSGRGTLTCCGQEMAGKREIERFTPSNDEIEAHCNRIAAHRARNVS